MNRMCKVLMLTIAVVGFSIANAQKNLSIEEKINGLINKMTIEEKVRMIHGNSSFTSAGVPRLGIPELITSDGPHGVRVEHGRGWGELKDMNDSGTYLPVGVALAATWNPALGFAFGDVLGSEAKYRGKHVILGPGINIMRSPLNGRNFEYQSEDPFLVSKMVVGYIKGVQNNGVSACVKHFMANNEEVDRFTVNVEMSERALREIYLPGFKAAVLEGDVNTIMGAYNKFRGQFCTHNDFLVNKILKGEWGFKGVLMSDWGAVHNTMEAINYGTDLEMGSDIGQPPLSFSKFYLGDTVVALVKNGKVPVSLIDDKVRRILRILYKSSAFTKDSNGEYGSESHIATAKKVAEESIVLMKNEASILPLKLDKIKSIAVIGANANRKNSMGGGSSQVKALYEITPLDGLKKLAKNIVFNCAEGYRIAQNEVANPQLIAEAVEAAKKSDVAIVVGGWTHGYKNDWDNRIMDAEAVDKPNMQMPFGQDELIKAVEAVNPNTIVVLVGGGPIDMTQWIGKTKGIIEAWYGGMEGGTALAEVIFGKINPSGKLPVTFPKVLEDVPAHKLGDFPGKNGVAVYREGIFVGYRYYDTYKVEPQFAFGHGLSYTTFSYKDLKLVKGVGNIFTATFSITNTGNIDGGEVAQLYIHKDKSSIERADKELKGFQKVFLKPNESKTVTISLNKEAFQYYNETKKSWDTELGAYTIEVGGSSRAIQLKAGVNL